MRPHTDVKVFRLPPNLSSKSIAAVKWKSASKVVQLETFMTKGSSEALYESRLLMGQTHLAVSVVTSDSLFLTRVSDSFEFRPQLQQSDKSSAASAGVEASSDDEKISAVTMRFASANEEDKRKARESLYSYHQEKVDREKWKELEFVEETSDRSQDARSSLARL